MEAYQPRLTRAADIKRGDRVYYFRGRSGWGGGETYRFPARVVKVLAKTAEIALWNGRLSAPEVRRVAITSLSRRDTTFEDLDRAVYR